MDTTTPKEMATKLIQGFEKRRLVAYLDQKGIPSIAWGNTTYPNGIAVKLGDTCTPAQADEYLNFHLNKYVYPELLCYDMPQKVYAAVCSLLYNIGHLGPSIKNVLTLKLWLKLPDCFLEYVICDKRIDEGLVNRRKAEISFFMN